MNNMDTPAASGHCAHEESLRLWLEGQLRENELTIEPAQEPQEPPQFWTAIRGDAGFRQYYRLHTKPSTIAVFSPPETEDNAQFCRIAHAFREHGIHTPNVIAHDFSHGFMLLEDLGNDVLLAELSEESVDGLYAGAMMSLLRIQQCPLDYSIYPKYDEVKLREEMTLFPQWFVSELLGYELSESESDMISGVFDSLSRSALEQPQVVVHRDFHSRNLLSVPAGSVGVIDFQDAVIGPITYDLVSLLRDCYITWDIAQVERWAITYARTAADVGVLPAVDDATFLRWFDLMGLQRHIKVLGIFARLSLRDGKHGYLDDLSLVVQYVRDVAARHSELNAFTQWFDAKLMPLIDDASWFSRS